MKYDIINACSDLGVHVNGSDKGPIYLSKSIKKNDNIENIYTLEKEKCIKSLDKNDKQKNLNEVNIFNENLYNIVKNVIDDNKFPITLGGDHSIVIASALASINKNKNLGIIWIDSHGDYNNFKTTISGNIHGLPFAAITGYDDTDKLTKFHSGNFYNTKNAVLVGARDLDEKEIENLKDAGITIFTTDEIKKYGVQSIMKKAFTIASQNTCGIHISYDIDVIDPNTAPGVSIPAINGISDIDAYSIMNYIIENKNLVKSLDIVEYNPELDIDNKTLNIATTLLDNFLNDKIKIKN